MNFTSDVKREIITRKITGRAERLAALSAFVRTSGALGVREGKRTFFIVSETENVAEFFSRLFETVFGEELVVSRAFADRMSGRSKLVMEYAGTRSEEILDELSLIGEGTDFHTGISERIFSHAGARIAYLKGAFLGGGSCILPAESAKTGYHLEFLFPEAQTAEDFLSLLDGEELFAKSLERSGGTVVYMKSKEAISDFLSAIGAVSALKKFSAIVEKRDEANRNNRAANCYSGNTDKTITASVGQVRAIAKLKETGAFERLPSELKALAEAREKNTEASLQELADGLGISKSCLSHRMRKLLQTAEKEVEK